MRCLSPYAKYSIQVFEAIVRRGTDRNGVVTEWNDGESVVANFDKSGLLDYEIEAVLEKFNFSGLPEGVNPLTRISVFDTEVYVQRFKPEERDHQLEQIDTKLRELQELHPTEFIIVEAPEAEKPWPSYDEHTPKQIIKYQSELGVSPEMIRLYELEHENRDEIVEAMLRIEDPESANRAFGPKEEEVVVEA